MGVNAGACVRNAHTGSRVALEGIPGAMWLVASVLALEAALKHTNRQS